MAVRYEQTIYDANGQDWTIYIHDSSWVSSSTSMEITRAQLQYQPIEQKRFSPIITSAAEITMRIRASLDNTFVNDFIGAAESRFWLQIDKGSSLEWAGVILTDNVQRQDKEYPYLFTIRATDGLGSLQNIDYNNAGTDYSGTARPVEHLVNCLNKLPHVSLYGSEVLSTAINWYSAEHASTAIDPVYQSRYDHRRYIKIDSQGTKSYASCFDVIKSIATAFGARFVQTDGNYKLITVNQYEGANFGFFNYNTSAVQNSTTTAATYRKTDFTDLERSFGGNYEYFPPLNQVTVNFKHFQAQSLIPATAIDSIGYTGDTDIDSASGTSKILLRFEYKYKVSFTTPANFEPCVVVFYVQLKVGSNYLKREAVFNGPAGYSYTDVTWESTASTYEIVSNPVRVNNTYDYSQVGTILTPAVPADGELTISGTALEVWNLNGVQISSMDADPDVEFYNAYLEVVVAGTVESRANEYRYSVTNSTSGNTQKLKIPTEIGDGPSLNALGALSVYNGSSFVASTGWDVDSTAGTVELGRLLAQEVLLTQDKPVEIINAQAFGTYTFLYSLYKGSADYAPLSATIDLIQAQTNGRWFKVDSTGASVVDIGTEAPFEPEDEPISPITPVISTTEPPFTRDQKGAAIQNTLIPTTLSTEITAGGGAITSIPINAIGQDDVIVSGDRIQITDVLTGLTDEFTVTADVLAADTSISVSSQTPAFDFSAGSVVNLTQEEILKKINTVSGGFTSFTVSADGGATEPILDGENIDFIGSDGLDVTRSGNNLTFSLDLSELLTSTVITGAWYVVGHNPSGTEYRWQIQEMLLDTLSSSDGSITIGTNGFDTNLTVTTPGGTMDDFVIRDDSSTTLTITDGYILDINGGNGIETDISSGDLDIKLDGPGLLSGFAFDNSWDMWIFSGVSSQRAGLDEVFQEMFEGVTTTATTPADSDYMLFSDVSASNTVKRITAQNLANYYVNNGLYKQSGSATTDSNGRFTVTNLTGSVSVFAWAWPIGSSAYIISFFSATTSNITYVVRNISDASLVTSTSVGYYTVYY